MLEVVEPRSALNVRQGLRSSHLLPFKDLPARNCPFKLPNELFQVVLHYPIQVHEITVDVVNHFDRCGKWTQEIQGCPSAECLDVAFMRRKQGDQTVCQAALSTDPRDDRVSFVQFFNQAIPTVVA